jgi:pimeloyl-ACP methyl ester carboxylesterase
MAGPVWTPVPIPAQVPATEGMASLPGAKLWYWDTGGDGPAVILLHANTGSGAFWAYQQPVLANAGYRVIGYSRRGCYRSEAGDSEDPGVASDDLNDLVEYLGIKTFHAVGLALGGIIAMDYALSHGKTLLSLTLVATLLGVTDEDYVETGRRIRPPVFLDLPPEFRELGPSYRAGNPEGAAAWRVLEQQAVSGKKIIQRFANVITWAKVETVAMPVLLMGGDADLYTPPSMLRLQANHIRHAEMVLIAEAGHAPNWEQPEAFNRTLLSFLQANGGA